MTSTARFRESTRRLRLTAFCAALAVFAPPGALVGSGVAARTAAGRPSRTALLGGTLPVVRTVQVSDPRLGLSDGADLRTAFVGPAALLGDLDAGRVAPLALVADDFDEDGAPDLAWGATRPGGGALALHRGAARTLAAAPPRAFRVRASAVALPEPAALMGAGDFDNDGHRDVVAASNGGAALRLLSGDGRGGFAPARTISLPGRVTALAAGEMNRANGLADLVVAVEGAGPRLLVFEGPGGALNTDPEVVELPAPATAIAFGQLDGDFALDAAVVAGQYLLVVHGRGRGGSALRVSARSFDVELAGLAVAELTGDRRPDVAVVSADGAVLSLDPRASAAEVRPIEEWVVTRIAETAPSRGTRLVRARVSGLACDDLLVVDASSCRMQVIAGGVSGGPLDLEVEGGAAAVLPVRLNADARDDLVVMRRGSGVPALALTSPRQTFTVTNTNDTGAGSLRKAIEDANASAGPDTISFNIPGPGVRTIAPGSALPSITDSATIDARTQPGYADRPLVELDGTGAGAGVAGLSVDAGGCLIAGFAINRFGRSGVRLHGPGGCTVVACYVGTDAAGEAGAGNVEEGVRVDYSPNNTIGGTTALDRNVISGNGSEGVEVDGPPSTGNLVVGNYIGPNAASTAAIGNQTGVSLRDAPGNTVGGTTESARNVISGSVYSGVAVAYGPSVGNLVMGNFVGTDATGTMDLGNGGDGIGLGSLSTDSIAGGPAVGAANLVAFNRRGVVVGAFSSDTTPSAGNLIQRNSIRSNDELGINISTDYDGDPDVNDPGDGDAGPNGKQNYPVIETVSVSSGSTIVAGTLGSRPNTTYTLDFYASSELDPSGFGEGDEYLGSKAVATGASGVGTFQTTFPVDLTGKHITATATDPDNNTSEFCQSRQVGGVTDVDLQVTIGDNVDVTVPGGTIGYGTFIRNRGLGPATNAVLEVVLSADVTLESVSSGSNGWSIQEAPPAGSSGTVRFVNPYVGPGTEAFLFVNVRVRPNTPTNAILATTALVSSESNDTAPENDMDVAQTLVLDPALSPADLSVTISEAPDPTINGSLLAYTMQIRNEGGPFAALDARLMTSVPEGTTFVSSTTSGYCCVMAPPVGESGPVEVTLGTIPVGARVAVTIVVLVTAGAGTVLTNTATVTAASVDEVPGNNTVAATTNVITPAGTADLSVTVTDEPDPVEAGGNVVYTIRITNRGPDMARSVTVFVTSGRYISFVDASPADTFEAPPVGDDDGGQVTFALGSLEAGASTTATLTLKASTTDPSYAETVTVLSASTDPNPEDNTETETTSVVVSAIASAAWDEPEVPSDANPLPPPRNLGVRIADTGTRPPPPLLRSPRDARLLGYRVYRSSMQPVATTPGNLFTSLPPTTTQVDGAPVAPGGTFFVVTAVYTTGESAGTDAEQARPTPLITKITFKGNKVVVVGEAFTGTVQVFLDGLPFRSPAKVTKANSKVVQKGPLLDGTTLDQYLRPGRVVTFEFRNSDGRTNRKTFVR